MSETSHIRWEISGNTGIITIENPPQNVLEQPDFISIGQLREWADLSQVNGLIIRGAGRHFSAGADLEKLFALARNKEALFDKMEAGKAVLNALSELDIPVIAAIKGVCFGGGLEIALSCHMRVCSSTSLFAFPEVSHNLLPGLSGTVRLSQIIGESAALELLLSGDTVDGEQASKIRLADYSLPAHEVHDFSLKLMERMVGGKIKKVVQNVMRAWHNSRKLTPEEAMKAETHLFCELAQDELKRRNAR